MKAAALFVKALEAEGVHSIFGVHGEENLDLVEALRNSSIRLIVTRHEQAAEFMAATWGLLIGEVSNPDFANFAEAHGAHGHRPASAAEFPPTLKRAFDAGGVHLIDLAIDYSDNHHILNVEIRRLSAAV